MSAFLQCLPAPPRGSRRVVLAQPIVLYCKTRTQPSSRVSPSRDLADRRPAFLLLTITQEFAEAPNLEVAFPCPPTQDPFMDLAVAASDRDLICITAALGVCSEPEAQRPLDPAASPSGMVTDMIWRWTAVKALVKSQKIVLYHTDVPSSGERQRDRPARVVVSACPTVLPKRSLYNC